MQNFRPTADDRHQQPVQASSTRNQQTNRPRCSCLRCRLWPVDTTLKREEGVFAVSELCLIPECLENSLSIIQYYQSSVEIRNQNVVVQ